jgi:hypothetical protein
MCDAYILPPTLENRKTPCKKYDCPNPKIDFWRINNLCDDACFLTPKIKNRESPCNRAICGNREIELLRINNQVRMSSSMRTLNVSAGCGQQKKDPKFFSYERVYMRRRSCATQK